MKRRFGANGHAIAGVFVFLLLGVFAVFSTLLVLFGAQAYRATTSRTSDHSTDRMLSAYVLNSVRSDDAAGAVGLDSTDGIDMLKITYDFDGDIYEKRIYCYTGYLRELFSSAWNEFDPASGTQICPAADLRAELDGNLLTVEITDADGEAHTVETVPRTTR